MKVNDFEAVPKDYKKVMEKLNDYLQQGVDMETATLKVFEEVKA